MAYIKCNVKKLKFLAGFTNQISFLSERFHTDEGFKDLLPRIAQWISEIRENLTRVKEAYKELAGIDALIHELLDVLFDVENVIRARRITPDMKIMCSEELFAIADKFATLWSDEQRKMEMGHQRRLDFKKEARKAGLFLHRSEMAKASNYRADSPILC